MTRTLDDLTQDPAVLAGVDLDNAYGNQCWDLVELYAELVLGVPKEPWAITLGPEGAAKEAWTVFDDHMQKYFDKVPKGEERKGYIAVYDGHGTYTEGHIAIWLDDGFVFEQNADPDGSLPHIYKRPTTYLLGSLRYKGGDDMYPNKGDIINYSARTGWQAGTDGKPSDNTIAYWTTGTGNPHWSDGGAAVWKALMEEITMYELNKPTPDSKTVTKQDVLNYLNGNLK